MNRPTRKGIIRLVRANVLLILLISIAPITGAQVIKVGGETFIPKGLIFSDSDPKSRVSGEGELSDGCDWVLESETKVAEQRIEKESPEQDCIRYFYQTGVELRRRCPAPAQLETSRSERTTTRAPQCPAKSGKIVPPSIEARAISSGETPNGLRQQIVVHPDGTRLTIQWNDDSISVQIRYPDGTVDQLNQKAKPPEQSSE